MNIKLFNTAFNPIMYIYYFHRGCKETLKFSHSFLSRVFLLKLSSFSYLFFFPKVIPCNCSLTVFLEIVIKLLYKGKTGNNNQNNSQGLMQEGSPASLQTQINTLQSQLNQCCTQQGIMNPNDKKRKTNKGPVKGN